MIISALKQIKYSNKKLISCLNILRDMINILINDSFCTDGEKLLRQAGFHIHKEKIEQENLINEINLRQIHVLIVRSATIVDKNVIDNCPTLKFIGRAGLGMNNIDMEYARTKGIELVNTPLASAPAVAEFVFAQLLSVTRNLYMGNRQLPAERDINSLKIICSGGSELTGKTLGIIGFGRAGQEVAKRALGLGLKVLAWDAYVQEANIIIEIPGCHHVVTQIYTVKLDKLLAESDFITLHSLPSNDKKPIISKNEIEKMKDGVILINVSKAELLDEQELISGLNSGKIRAAGIDVFKNEPAPLPALITHPKVSVSPHIGGETLEAQSRISVEMANNIIKFFSNHN